MNSFTNLIGIKGKPGAVTQPDSGLWLHKLPHLEFGTFDAAIGKEAVSAYDELVELVDLAALMTIQNIRDILGSKFNLNSVLENTVAGMTKDNLPVQAAQPYLTGVNIRIQNYPYLEFFLSRIGVHLTTSGDVTVKIWDLISEEELHSITVTAVANRPVYLDVAKRIKTNARQLNIFIGYDATARACYKTDLNSRGYCSECSNAPFLKYHFHDIRGGKIATGSQKIYSNVVNQNGTSGILLDYSLACDIDRYGASIKNQLAFPIWYISGMLILEHIVASKRYTNLVRLYKTDYQDAIKDYQIKHSNALKNVFRSFTPPQDICFYCEPRMRTKVVLP